MSRGGNIVDSHSIDYFPERWFDLVLVLRTNNTVLFDRLTKRGYSQKKVTENIVRLRCYFFCVGGWCLVWNWSRDRKEKISLFRCFVQLLLWNVSYCFFFFFSPLLTMNLFLVFSFPFPFPFRLLFLFFFSSPSSIYLGM